MFCADKKAGRKGGKAGREPRVQLMGQAGCALPSSPSPPLPCPSHPHAAPHSLAIHVSCVLRGTRRTALFHLQRHCKHPQLGAYCCPEERAVQRVDSGSWPGWESVSRKKTCRGISESQIELQSVVDSGSLGGPVCKASAPSWGGEGREVLHGGPGCRLACPCVHGLV